MKNLEFDYPIDYEIYSVEEIQVIINFLDTVEECYSKGVTLEIFEEKYKNFKSIVKAKSEERKLLSDFKNITTFDGYQCVKQMRDKKAIIKL